MLELTIIYSHCNNNFLIKITILIKPTTSWSLTSWPMRIGHLLHDRLLLDRLLLWPVSSLPSTFMTYYILTHYFFDSLHLWPSTSWALISLLFFFYALLLDSLHLDPTRVDSLLLDSLHLNPFLLWSYTWSYTIHLDRLLFGPLLFSCLLLDPLLS